MNNSNEVTNQPLVSIVMPIRNEEAFIEKNLNAIVNQTYPKQLLEVIIADGMSTDGTREIIRNLKEAADVKIILIDNPDQFMPAGLNRAIENSMGEIVVLIGGHCEIDERYIENCVKHLQAKKADVVGGPIETIGKNLESETIAEAMSSRFGVGGSPFRTIDDKELYVDTVAFGAYKKEILQKSGAFDEELIRDQDDEYNYRIRKLGGKILLAPDIRSKYYSRGTMRKLWKQYFDYGFYKVRVLQLHPFQMRLRQFIPLIFVTSLIFSLVIGLFSFYGLSLFALICSAYTAGNIFASLKVASQKGLKMLKYLPFCFAILHLSYGFGFLCGLIYFMNRWGKVAAVRDLQIKNS